MKLGALVRTSGLGTAQFQQLAQPGQQLRRAELPVVAKHVGRHVDGHALAPRAATVAAGKPAWSGCLLVHHAVDRPVGLDFAHLGLAWSHERYSGYSSLASFSSTWSQSANTPGRLAALPQDMAIVDLRWPYQSDAQQRLDFRRLDRVATGQQAPAGFDVVRSRCTSRGTTSASPAGRPFRRAVRPPRLSRP